MVDKADKKVLAKHEAIKVAIANMDKQFGNKTGVPTIRRFGDIPKRVDIPSISFGISSVDDASYCGGVPQGKLIEIFGPESSGKSYLTLKLMASAQKAGKYVCLFDIEQSFDEEWAEKQGIDVDNLYYMNDMPGRIMSAENVLDCVYESVHKNSFDLIVVDSTAALVPEKELSGSIGDQDYALLARSMSKALRKIISELAKKNTTCIFINQIRDSMAKKMNPNQDTTTTPGGRALKFYSHQRINVVGREKIWSEENGKKVVVARNSFVKFVKNKVARPFGECEMQIVFDSSMLNPVTKLCEIAKRLKLIKKASGYLKLAKVFSESGTDLIDTGSETILEVADFIVRHNMVNIVYDKVLETAKSTNTEIDVEEMKVIEKIKSEPESVKSPLESKIVEKIDSDLDDGDEEEDAELEKIDKEISEKEE